jgi:hypothetical protein
MGSRTVNSKTRFRRGNRRFTSTIVGASSSSTIATVTTHRTSELPSPVQIGFSVAAVFGSTRLAQRANDSEPSGIFNV